MGTMVELIIELLRAAGIDYGFFRLVNYVTFRAIMAMTMAMLFCLIFGFRIIYFLYLKRFRDTSEEYTSIVAYSKKGTPTSGGLMIILSTVFSVLVWAKFSNPLTFVLLYGFVYLGFVGFIDDFQKTRLKSSLAGLSQMAKTILQFLFIIPFAIYFLSPMNPMSETLRTLIYIPFYKYPVLNLGIIGFFVFILFVTFSIINAVNITDGMDGLLGGTSAITLGVYAVFAYIIGNSVWSRHFLFPYIEGSGELAVFAAALVGAILGFLWYNTYPAEVFMGDTGSLAIGGVMAMLIFFTKQEMLFVIAGGIFILEIFTSLLQDKLGNRMGRRVVHRAPYHHTLTHSGIAEPKAVIRLWIVAVILALVAIASIKIR